MKVTVHSALVAALEQDIPDKIQLSITQTAIRRANIYFKAEYIF